MDYLWLLVVPIAAGTILVAARKSGGFKKLGSILYSAIVNFKFLGKNVADEIENDIEEIHEGMEDAQNNKEIKEKLAKEYPTVLGIEVTKDGKIE